MSSSWPTNDAPAATEGGELDFGRVFFGRKVLLLLTIALGCAAGYYQFLRAVPVYQSHATIHVVQQRAPISVDEVEEMVVDNDPVATHTVLLRSPVIIELAVELHGLAELPSLKGRDPVSGVTRGLSITRDPTSTDILQLQYAGPVREDCPKILAAVIDAYSAYLARRSEQLGQKAGSLIAEAKGQLMKDLAAQQKRLTEFERDSSMLWQGEEGINLHLSRLGQIENSRAELLIDQRQIRAELQELQVALEQGGNRETLMLLIDRMSGSGARPDGQESSEVRTLTGTLLKLQLEEQLLLDKIAPGHPKVREIRRKIEIARQLSGQDADAPPADFIQVYLSALRQQMKLNQSKLEQLDAFYKQEEGAAKLLATEESEHRAMADEIEQTRELFNATVGQLQKLSLNPAGGGMSADVVAPPTRAYQVSPNFVKMISLGGLGGLVLGVCLSWLFEMADKSFRSSRDISTRLGLPVLAELPEMRVTRSLRRSLRASPVAPEVLTFHRPQSDFAEEIRVLRASIFFSTNGENHRVLQVTSPTPSAGKSTISSNLAVAIAASGRSCLLIDGDCRRPQVARLLGLDNSHGLTSILSEEVDLPDLVRETEVPNLWALPSGSPIRHPGDVLISDKFRLLVEQAREKYDYVIIDTPPVLAVNDPTTVAALADGVVMVCKISKQNGPEMLEAKRVLDLVEANMIGVAVNEVAPTSKGYGRGKQGYKRYSSNYKGAYAAERVPS